MTSKQKRLAKALLIACALEAAFAGSFALGGLGPCGPTNALGFLGMLAHMPAILLIGPLSALATLPTGVEFLLAALVQIGVLTALVRGVHRLVEAVR